MANLQQSNNGESDGSLRNRRLIVRDTSMIARWMIEDHPVPPSLAAELQQTLGALLRNEQLFGVCVEERSHGFPNNGAAPRPVAFGLSTFLTDTCVDAQLSTPIPHFAVDLIRRAWRKQSDHGMLSSRQIGEANGGGGLNLFPAFWLQRPNDPTNPQGARLLIRAMQTLLVEHRGYNIKRIIKEGSRQQEQVFLKGGMNKLRTYSDGLEERFLFGLTRDEALQNAFGTGLSLLFESVRPCCRFTRIQQHVLECAADDMSDEEIADHLNLAVDTVKKRWRTIYERLELDEGLSTYVFGSRAAPNNNGHRDVGAGSQKRRHVVAYVRSHPEELRPYAWG